MPHSLEPVYDNNSKVLILGSFPSVISREVSFYYGNPQNRFWKVLAAILHDKIPVSTEEKIQLLHESHIALWDVVKSCQINGSSDASIQDVQFNDIYKILYQIHKLTPDCNRTSGIIVIICNGNTAYKLFQKYLKVQDITLDIPYVLLSSTSPANAAWSLDALVKKWGSTLRNFI